MQKSVLLRAEFLGHTSACATAFQSLEWERVGGRVMCRVGYNLRGVLQDMVLKLNCILEQVCLTMQFWLFAVL